uniref:Uncharacterized protein n=1 Tax=Cajanus cajan TaxID=3821 RepID=A0A151TQ16_CAJCA|nr:hypothetical protein KK1_022717 [Cajanus cajan]
MMVVSWLLRSLSPFIAHNVIWRDTASSIWSDLEERFSQGDLFRITSLQDTITPLKQREMSDTNYFTKLKTLWDELEVFCSLPICTYAIKCSCNALVNIGKYKTQDQVIKFLRGLTPGGTIICVPPMIMSRAFLSEDVTTESLVLPNAISDHGREFLGQFDVVAKWKYFCEVQSRSLALAHHLAMEPIGELMQLRQRVEDVEKATAEAVAATVLPFHVLYRAF